MKSGVEQRALLRRVRQALEIAWFAAILLCWLLQLGPRLGL